MTWRKASAEGSPNEGIIKRLGSVRQKTFYFSLLREITTVLLPNLSNPIQSWGIMRGSLRASAGETGGSRAVTAHLVIGLEFAR